MRTVPRLPTFLAILALLAARPLASQTSSVATPPVPATRSLWFDAGALLEDQVRLGVEAVPLGRVTLGLAIGYSHTTHPRDEIWPPPYYYAADGTILPQCDPRMLSLCAYPPYGYGEPSHYRAWTFDLSARYYPAALSFRNGGARVLVYGGAYVGYHWRTWEEQPYYSYYCPPGYLCAMPAVPGGTPVASPADSLVPLPQYPTIPWVSPLRHTLKGLEPGLELGVRLLPAGPLFLEVGGRFTLVVVDDRMQHRLPGDVDARLVLAGGLAW